MKTHVRPGVLVRHDPSDPVPLVFDSPHSGIEYPEDFRHAAPWAILRAAEDTHVDDLYGAAPAHGASLLCALFPRSYIDANRHEGDIDAGLLAEPWPGDLQPGEKSKLGLGLIRRLAQPDVPIYDRKLPVAEVRARLAAYYQPYHAELQSLLEARHRRFGAVWHVNCHSMGSKGSSMSVDNGRERPDFVLGDRDGSTCDRAFTDAVLAWLNGRGYHVTVNDPYKGVELVRRYSDPAKGCHSLQIEVNRRLYMDEKTRERGGGYAKLKADITELVAYLAEWTQEAAG